jgi:hypothetical protein
MIPREHLRFTDGSTFEASRLTQNLRLLADDVNDALARRYAYSSFTLDFSTVNNTFDPAEFAYQIPTLFAYDIVGVEIELYAATNVTSVTMTVTGAGVSGAETTTAVGAGVTTRAFAQNSFVAQVASGTATYTLSVAASSTPWTLTACRVNVMIRTDRGNAGAAHPMWTPSNLAFPGKTTNEAAFDAEIVAADASTDANIANTKRLRMEVFTRRSIPGGAMAASDQDLPIPPTTRTVAQVVTGVVCAATSSMRGAVRDSSSELVGATATGTGLSSLALATTTTTAAVSIASSTGASDGLIRLSRGTGTDAISFVYTVAYWSL